MLEGLHGGRPRKGMFAFLKRRAVAGAGQHVDAARYVVIDLELTGLDERRDSIVSLGALRMEGGRIDLGTTFSRLVSPRTELSAASVVIHEITPSEVEAKPGIDAVLDEFLAFCGADVVVGHCVGIDLAFLNRERKRRRMPPVRNAAVDTPALYEWLRKRNAGQACFALPPEAGLYEVAACFGIPVNGAHKALMDAFITAQLFQRMLPVLVASGVETIGQLMKIAHPYKGGDRFRTTGEIGNF
jgi:DNA polymerase-3 subunit epsilon